MLNYLLEGETHEGVWVQEFVSCQCGHYSVLYCYFTSEVPTW